MGLRTEFHADWREVRRGDSNFLISFPLSHHTIIPHPAIEWITIAAAGSGPAPILRAALVLVTPTGVHPRNGVDGNTGHWGVSKVRSKVWAIHNVISLVRPNPTRTVDIPPRPTERTSRLENFLNIKDGSKL